MADFDVLKNKECALFIDKNNVCMSKHTLKKLYDFYKSKTEAKDDKNISPQMLINNLKKILNVDHESCILMNEEVKKYLGEKTIMIDMENYKAYGSHDSETLMSMDNLFDVLKQFRKKYSNFCPFPIHAVNFNDIDSPLKIFPLSEVFKKYMRTAIIFNTDIYGNRGKHWFCVYGEYFNDEKKITLEFFNSSGNYPSTEIHSWLIQSKYDIEKQLNVSCEIIIVSQFRHQYGNIECGSYALYYIYSRLSGIGYEYFMKNRIPDEKIFEFRKAIFRKC